MALGRCDWTQRAFDDMTEWVNRPLDRVYPVVFTYVTSGSYSSG